MLPLPGTNRPSRSRFFPSLPPNSAYTSHNHGYTLSSSQLLTHLRSRTRLTNLAVILIFSSLSLSLILNINAYLLTSNGGSLRAGRRKGYSIPTPWSNTNTNIGLTQAGWEDSASLEQIESGTPLSIETTIERDVRMGELDHLIMVPGHAIWVGHDASKAQLNDDWILEPMQRGGSVKTYIKHIEQGVEVLKRDPNALLVFSGGATRIPPSPPLPEALSYHNLATALHLLPSTPIPIPEGSTSNKPPLPLNLRAATEEYALDSYENLLFSFARFREVTGKWPARVTVVGYGMKRRRFEHLHRAAIGFPLERFQYIGIDDEGNTTDHYAGELKYGFTPFLTSPSGCHPPLSIKRTLRNPYSRYHPYHTSCPEIIDLLEWCPPLGDIKLVGDDGEGIEVFKGNVPWSGLNRAKEEDGEVVWDREKY